MITRYFQERLGIRALEPEPSDGRYQCWNTGGVEREVGEFFYALVLMMKPERVLETGTHMGISSSYIAQGMKENGFGKLTTIEYEQSHINTAKQRFNDLQLNDYVEFVYSPSLEWRPPHNFSGSNEELSYDQQPKTQYDIILLDTEPQIRFQEFVKFHPYLEMGGAMFIHDLHPHCHQIDTPQGFGVPYGPMPDEMKKLLLDDYQRVHFRTPRGLSMFYKLAPEDFKP